jgi:hypothetical protein
MVHRQFPWHKHGSRFTQIELFQSDLESDFPAGCHAGKHMGLIDRNSLRSTAGLPSSRFIQHAKRAPGTKSKVQRYGEGVANAQGVMIFIW